MLLGVLKVLCMFAQECPMAFVCVFHARSQGVADAILAFFVLLFFCYLADAFDVLQPNILKLYGLLKM